MESRPFIPGQRRFVLGLHGRPDVKPFRLCLPYVLPPPASLPPAAVPLTIPNVDLEAKIPPKMKSVSPFERGEPDLRWALPVDPMAHIEDTSNSRKGEEAPKKAKQATKVC